MAKKQAPRQAFNVLIVGQSGRLQYEAILFAASLRHCSPEFEGNLYVAVPQAGPKWRHDPSIRSQDVLATLDMLGATVLPFDSNVFGASYPHGNKIEALLAMPEGEPFVFFDTDTLITGDLMSVPFDFSRPGASLRREGTWPHPTLYGPGYNGIWKSLYDRFGLDFASSLDPSQPDEYWRRYLYFNAGWFFYADPRAFGHRFLEYAQSIRDDPPVELAGQSLDPWLDQIALPLVIHSFGGGQDVLPEGLLETISAPNKIKKVIKAYDPIKRIVFQGRGAKVRMMFDRDNLPRKEQAIRNRIKSAGFWMR